MYSYVAEDISQALQFGIEHLLQEGVEETSRNGPVLVSPGPVCIEYLAPRERVLFSPTRDANPFFHLMESLWMLAGSNECEFPRYFNKTYSQYSDDGGRTMWDAYGWRWRRFFGWDQLEAIVTELRSNPNSRRCVLAMWNGSTTDQVWEKLKDSVLQFYPLDSNDFFVATHGGNAVPCNTHAYLAIRSGRLNMTVCNRSNDAVWGCFGANAVHFSFLLEYLAMRIGVEVGSYYQFTNNLHVYTDKFSREKLDEVAYECATLGAAPATGPAISEGFDEDLALFMPWALEVSRAPIGDPSALNIPDLKTEFMYSVAAPMFLTWVYRKWGDEYSSVTCLNGIAAPDWQRACDEWVDRRRRVQ